MRRSIDEVPFDPLTAPPDEEDELGRAGWSVSVSDDYEDAEPRVLVTVEELGRAGQGLSLHLDQIALQRLRATLGTAARSIGMDAGA